MKIKTITHDEIEIDDLGTFELSYRGADKDSFVTKVEGNAVKIGYLVRDDDCPHPLEDCDGMGEIIRVDNRNWHDATQEVLDSEKPHVKLTVYLHGGEHWSIQNSAAHRNYPDQQWDVAQFAGIWVPDKYCLESLTATACERADARFKIKVVTTAAYGRRPEDCRDWDLETCDGKHFNDWGLAGEHAASLVRASEGDRAWEIAWRHELNKMCQGVLDPYNSWLAGDCWGVRVDTFELDTHKRVEDDACWGYIGRECAEEELKARMG